MSGSVDDRTNSSSCSGRITAGAACYATQIVEEVTAARVGDEVVGDGGGVQQTLPAYADGQGLAATLGGAQGGASNLIGIGGIVVRVGGVLVISRYSANRSALYSWLCKSNCKKRRQGEKELHLVEDLGDQKREKVGKIYI